jgi:hypothetical protein
MSDIYKSSSLFALPLELREDIYRRVFSFPNQGSNILRTCREISTEARKFLYQKPLFFKSQEAFYTWSSSTPRNLLAHVLDVSIYVQDVDLKPILSLGTSTLSHQTPRLLTTELYQADIDKFKQALAQLPKVKAVTIQTPLKRPSYLYRDFITQILGSLSTLCPNLLDLRLEGNFHHHDLHFLACLKNLESFSFNGFASTSPAATANIIASLHRLTNLNLVSEHAYSTPGTDFHGEYIGKRLSFSGEVVRTIKQLASISVIERTTIPSPILSFMPDVLSSLHAHKTLKSLSVRLSHTPDVAVLASLEEFLDQTPIKDLELDWPNLKPIVLEQYRLVNGYLQVFWAKTECERDASGILHLIAHGREAGNSSQLEKVVLIRDIQLYSKTNDLSSIGTENLTEHSFSVRASLGLVDMQRGVISPAIGLRLVRYHPADYGS